MSETLKDYRTPAVTRTDPPTFDPDALRQEATRVLQHALFSHSERSSKLLRYLVSVSLKNASSSLKERTIGHDVFGREAGYDTYADPIVRNAASEVRRRLKQYYETASKDQPRIELPTGQYLVVLRVPNHPGSESKTEPKQTPEEPPAEPLAELPEERRPRARIAPETVRHPPKPDRRTFLYGLAGAVAGPALLWGGFELGRRDPVISDDPFWSPVVRASSSILLSVGSDDAVVSPPENNPEPISFPEGNTIALTRVAARLVHYGIAFRVRPDILTTMSDMRDSTPVLIGDSTQTWVQRILPELRFLFGRDGSAGAAWVQDAQNSKRRWSTQIPQLPTSSFTDYAIVARLRSKLTGGIVVLLSGVGSEAAGAAAEFVTGRKFLASLPGDFSNPDRNLQFVLKTTVVDGVTAPPELVAQASW